MLQATQSPKNVALSQEDIERLSKSLAIRIQHSQELRLDLLGSFMENYARRLQSDGFHADSPSRKIMLHDVAGAPAEIETLLDPRDLHNVRQQVLHRLAYQERTSRFEAIPAAFKQTFEWVFDSKSVSKNGTGFPEWLESDASLFWISGKPAAGKSTLMKFIGEDERTRIGLKRWAKEHNLVTLGFYFWCSGTEIQMSQEGLLQSLLYDGLSQLPALISAVLPQRTGRCILFGPDGPFEDNWTRVELLRAFRLFLQHAKERYRIVLMIDGLDEFGGDQTAMIELLESLSSPGVKLCVSSRPWNVFTDAFGQGPNLRVEDLTRDDIRHYVSAKMCENLGFAALERLDSERAKILIENVTLKASGVFLWVALVTKSLLEGLSDGEHLSELQDRLDELPPDLEDLFWSILRRLGRAHFRRASQMFQYLRASVKHLTALELSYADEDDENTVFQMATAPLSVDYMQSREEIVSRRINGCCRGLLEINEKMEGFEDFESWNGRLYVYYLHRTVRDWIYRDEIWAALLEANETASDASQDFNVNARLCRSQIAMIKIFRPSLGPTLVTRGLGGHLKFGVEYALRSDHGCNGLQQQLLNSLEGAAVTYGSTNAIPSRLPLIQSPGELWAFAFINTHREPHFIHFAAALHLLSYVESYLRTLPQNETTRQLLDSLLYTVIMFTGIDWSYNSDNERLTSINSGSRSDTIKLLLRQGANPNVIVKGKTAWQLALQKEQPDVLDLLRPFAPKQKYHGRFLRILNKLRS